MAGDKGALSTLLQRYRPVVMRHLQRYPVDDADRNSYLDLNLATQNALEEMVRHLTDERSYTEAQAQVIVSVACDLRINVVNNPPNPVVSVALPRPSSG